MKYKNKKSVGHRVIGQTTPVFEVTFGCYYKTITSLKVEAPGPEEATVVAESVIRESRIEGPDEGAPSAWIGSAGVTQLVKFSLLAVRPQGHPNNYDLTGINFGEYLGPTKHQ
ncbi:MAG TPA: hypothetical protein VFE51_11205 [Verrucomicrobiae bacterium]|nr:hypothetical protein [Verrucomicrobiae bacterium]